MSADSREGSALRAGRHAPRPAPHHHGTALGCGTPMRILLVADEYPWPARSGYRQRLHWMLHLLTRHGSVDLLVVREQPPVDPPGPPPDVPLHRSAVVAAGRVVLPRALRTRRWLTGEWPRAMVG